MQGYYFWDGRADKNKLTKEGVIGISVVQENFTDKGDTTAVVNGEVNKVLTCAAEGWAVGYYMFNIFNYLLSMTGW